MNRQNELKLKIAENTKNISSEAYVSFLEADATTTGCLIEGDLVLTRMSRALSTIARHNTSERLIQLQQKINTLNLFRSMFTYKPNGIDALVDELGTKFFFAAIDHGMGLHQLRPISYLFPIDLLNEYELVYLRNKEL